MSEGGSRDFPSHHTLSSNRLGRGLSAGLLLSFAVPSVSLLAPWTASPLAGSRLPSSSGELSSGGVSSNSGWRVSKSLPILESWDGLSKPTGGSPSVVAFGCAVGASDVVLGPVDRLPRLAAPV